MAKRPDARTAVITVPAYLAAVRTVHGLAVRDLARALDVSPSLVRRWLRGKLVPTWPRVRTMVALWGGDPAILGLGAAVQRHCRASGMSVDEAVTVIRTGKRAVPTRRTVVRDRRQIPLPIS